MSRAGQSVDRVLAGLRDAAPPAGMKQRVMRAVEERASSTVRQGRRVGWVAIWAACGCAAALIVAAAVVPAMRRSITPERSQVRSARVTVAAPSHQAAGDHAMYAVDRPVERARAAKRRVAAAPAAAVVTTSRPAPPQPVTKEERLLLEVARRQDPKALELLNPELQRAQEMEAKAEFDRFFGLSERTKNE